MKKFLALILALVMVLSLVACGTTNNDTPVVDDTNDTDDTIVETGLNTVAPAEDAKGTLGYMYYEKILEIKTANPSATAEEIVMAIMESKLGTACPGCMVAPVEPNMYLQGLEAESFGGFVSGQVIIPMMMGQAFIVYVFDLADASEAPAFVESLKNNANPGWNICTTAETVTVGAVENVAFIAMCQKDIPASVSGIASVITPEAEEGSEVAILFDVFKNVMPELESLEMTSMDVANAMVANDVSGTVSEAEEYIVNDHFLYEVDGWGAAKISNGEKEIYIFALGLGADVQNWANYYCETKEGANLAWGAYNETVIVFLGFTK